MGKVPPPKAVHQLQTTANGRCDAGASILARVSRHQQLQNTMQYDSDPSLVMAGLGNPKGETLGYFLLHFPIFVMRAIRESGARASLALVM